MSEEFTRRMFLKSAAIGATGLAAIGITGCAPSVVQDASKEAAAEATGELAVKVSLPDLSTAKEEVDVVVVGSGAAGMAAAIEAAARGLKVTLLEVNETLGGNANFAEGIFGFNSKYQQALGLKYDANEMVQGDVEYSHYRADYRLVKEFILGADENIEWLEEMGVQFYDQLGGAKYQTQHLYKGKGMSMINDSMKPRAEKLGVKIQTSTRGTHVYMDNGKIAGVLAEKGDGAYPIKTKVVVLAAGGFIQNDEMVKNLAQFDPKKMLVTATPKHVGDGINMAYEAGGDQSGAKLLHLIWAGIRGIPFENQASVAACNEPNIWVNTDGVRFADEGLVVGKVTETCNAILTQKKVFAIMAQSEVDRLMKEPCTIGWGSYVFAGTVMEKVQEELDKILAKNPDNVFKADAIAGIAEKIGVDASTLQATVDGYNAMCDAGADTDFGKNPAFMRKLAAGPFYAFELDCNVFCSMGGIRVNTRNEVLDTDFNPIPGLYGAGVDCSGLYGDTYCISLSGSAQGYAVYSGRNSAKNAEGYVKG